MGPFMACTAAAVEASRDSNSILSGHPEQLRVLRMEESQPAVQWWFLQVYQLEVQDLERE